jgi:uncharacterized protein
MPLFVLHCRDKADALALRMENRPAHLAYAGSIGAQLMLAGPLLDDTGTTPIGSLIIVDMADRATAEVFAAGDPYAKAGLFETVTITPYRKVLPE